MGSYGWPQTTSDHSISWHTSALIMTTLLTMSWSVLLTEVVQSWRNLSFMFMELRVLMRRFRMQHGTWYLFTILPWKSPSIWSIRLMELSLFSIFCSQIYHLPTFVSFSAPTLTLQQLTICPHITGLVYKIQYWYFYASLEKGGVLFCNCRSVCRSVCRPSVVRSISFDPFIWSIPNLVQALPLMSRWSLLIFRSHEQRSMSIQCS